MRGLICVGIDEISTIVGNKKFNKRVDRWRSSKGVNSGSPNRLVKVRYLVSDESYNRSTMNRC